MAPVFDDSKNISQTVHFENTQSMDSDIESGKHTAPPASALPGEVTNHPQSEPCHLNERRIVRKIDLYVVPTVSLLYLFCFIDRANIGNARLAGFERDLKLTGYQYNQVLSVFYISYIIFEIPGTMACKWMGPGWFLPLTTLGFGVVTVAFAFVHDVQTACGVRFILGIFEAPMLPGIAYYLSRWYRRSELALRLALYVVMAPLAGAFGGLLASAILKLDSFGATRRWQMIFAIEGTITIALALIAFVTLTDRPETAKWLSSEEKRFVAERVKAERVGVTELLDGFDKAKVLRGILNPVTLATAWIFLLECVTVQGLAFFAPTIVRTIYPKETVVTQQLMTVPPYIVGAIFVIASAVLSSKTDRRNLILAYSAVPCIIGYTLFLASRNARVRYAAIFIIVTGAFNGGALCNAQVSANVVSDTARSSAIGTNVMFGNIGGLIATWAFLPKDAPSFPIGNGLNLAVQAMVLISGIILGIWMKRDNIKRAARPGQQEELFSLSEKEVADLDWRHPAFIWRS